MSSPSKQFIDQILQDNYPAKSHINRVILHLHSAEANAVSAGGIIFIESAKSKLWPNSDQEQPFRQSRYFYYLTGCDLPDCAVLYDLKTERSVLFIPPVVDAEVIWSGLPLSIKEALDKSVGAVSLFDLLC